MYLAKLFHRPPGGDDRELLFVPGTRTVIGTRLRKNIGEANSEFLRGEFDQIGHAVDALRHHVDRLGVQGFMETADTRYTLRNQPAGPQRKPDWQKALDDLMLSALAAPLSEQARHLAALAATQAAQEPLYLWLAAHHGMASEGTKHAALRSAEAARDALAARRAGKLPHYAWSIAESDLEARILDLVSDGHLHAGDPAAALEAIEQACRIKPGQNRGAQRAMILCDHFPDRREEAFDAAYKWAAHGGYDAIVALRGYADYVARRERKPKSEKAEVQIG